MSTVESLTEALPQAAFSETHQRRSRSSGDDAYERLLEIRWRDLKLTSFLMTVRGFWARRREGLSLSALLDEKWIDPESVFRPLAMKPGKYLAVGFLARPWNFTSEQPPKQPTTLEELKTADAEGGMKIGMDFAFLPTATGCLITTTTLCEPASISVARKFRPYWWLIRPFSGLIRREVLRHIAREVSGPRSQQ